MQGNAHLFQIVAALHASSRLPRSLHGREQQGHQNSNDGNHHQ
jgi:hypothetical protein